MLPRPGFPVLSHPGLHPGAVPSPLPRSLSCSSVPALAAGARLSRPQAEELQRFLRHDLELQLLPQPLPSKGKS